MPQRDRQLIPMEPFGVVVDLSADAVGQEFWTRCSSVVFRDHTERSSGKTAVWGATLFQPQWLLQTEIINSAEPIWIYCSLTGEIGAVEATPTHFDVSPVILDPVQQQNPWTGGELNGVPVVSHPDITNPLFWDRDTLSQFEPLPGWITGERALAFRPYKFHLIAMGMDRGAGAGFTEEVAWSSQAAPGTVPQEWLPSASNEAGSTTLGWTQGSIIDGAVLRDSFYIYKETSCYRMTYVGGAEVMLTELVLPDTGMLARNCVAELNNRHIVLTDDDVIIHDGHIVESVADEKTRNRIFNTIDPFTFGNSFCVTNDPEKEIWVCYPEVGATHPNIAAVYQARRNVWGFRDLTAMPAHIGVGKAIGNPDLSLTWDGQTEAWDEIENAWDSSGVQVGAYNLVEAGFDQSQLYLADQGDTDDGAAVLAVVAKERWDLGDPNRVKLLKAVWISARGTGGTEIRVRVAGTFNPQEDPTYGAYQTFVINNTNPAKVNVSALGKYLSVEFSSITTAPAWQIPNFQLEIEVGGLF